MKKCFKCGIEKCLSDFYVHKQMGDGHLNKCKECTRQDTKNRTNILLNDKDWCEQEKERHRNKYYRLGYKDKYKPNSEEKKEIMGRYKDKYPEKTNARKLMYKLDKLEKGMQYHHWSYNESDSLNVIILNYKDHAKIHRHLIYEPISFYYKTINGELLNTRRKHENYIKKVLSL